MAAGTWRVDVRCEVDPELGSALDPALLESAVAWAIRAGVNQPDRPIGFGLQPVLEVNLLIVGDDRIRQLNHDYRGLDSSTDVLSFSQIEGISGFMPAPSGRLALGDIVISLDTARRQAEGSLTRELRHLAVHGALHLLGYDHQTDEDEARMNSLASQALTA